MKVVLAGYNVDASILKELQSASGNREDLTPEVISAAYARISRDPRSIEEIRKDARSEVERARRSNSTIIFKMGHHSVAEHAVFNLDIVGASRYAMEEVEKFRLCSYTEKSQRYITLEKSYVIPQEIRGTALEKPYVEIVELQNTAYSDLFEKLKKHIFKKYSTLAKDEKNHSLLEGWAKEDARYITAFATESQVGLTINARNLELMLRRFASGNLEELRQLGQKIYECTALVAPSIVLFYQANDRDQKTLPHLRSVAEKIIKTATGSVDGKKKKNVELVEYTPCADIVVMASLLHSSSGLAYKKCKSIANNLSLKQIRDVFKSSWRYMQFYDSMLREYEYANLTFNIVISGACFGQLKRHRMTTLTAQLYDPGLGITLPESVREIGKARMFQEIIEKTNDTYDLLKKKVPISAPYVLTNAHRRRALLALNARELYHVSRLRQDAHAQWDIRQVTSDMVREAKKVMPLVFGLIGGKDNFNRVYRGIFGEMPKVTDVQLPGKRKIKCS